MSSSITNHDESESKSKPKEKQVKTRAAVFPPLMRHTTSNKYANTWSLVEVFKVRIDAFDDIERRGELYGSIQAIDMLNALTLYHRDRANPEHIRANCNISLIGPPRSISQVIGFAVSIDLRLCGVLEDVALAKWLLSWDAMNPKVAHITRGPFLRDFAGQRDMLSSQAIDKYQKAGYDEPLSAVFEGPNGSCITMYYAIFEHAAQAWIQIEVIDINAVPTVVEFDIRGGIYATCGHFERGNDSDIKDHCKTTLLETKELESVHVERWKSIPLSRSIIAVPAYSSLVIEANLWDTSQLKIAKGKLEFTTYHRGFGVDYIRGDNDIAIRVMLYWFYGSECPGRKSMF